jgi:D,D-heptose 1,7-bisphosphate phosphatase
MSNKAIFLDRDDTLIEDPGYINSPDQVKLLPYAASSLVELKQMGYKLIVVTNQSGIARGIVKEEALTQIHHQLKTLLGKEGAYLDDIYFCPYHPNGAIPKYCKESDLRKPNPGMILKAADDHDIDLAQSWMVGNSYRDITAGLRAGCRTILINSSVKPSYKKIGDPDPDKKAVNIREVVNIIKMYNLQENITKTTAQSESISPAESYHHETNKEAQKDIHEPGEHVTTEKIEEIFAGKAKSKDKPVQPEKTHRMLEEVLSHLKSKRREDMFQEFSFIKMFAGIAQVVAIFCLAISLVFLIGASWTSESVHTALGYAITLQLMAIGLYIMQSDN